MSERCPLPPTAPEMLVAVDTFIRETSDYTAQQLLWLNYWQPCARDPRAWHADDQRLTSVIDQNATLLNETLGQLSQNFGLQVRHPQEDAVAPIQGVAYSIETASYSAIIGETTEGQPISWPLLSSGQLQLGEAYSAPARSKPWNQSQPLGSLGVYLVDRIGLNV